MNPLSLRTQLLLLVGGPFVILLLVEAIVSYRIGLHSANQIYDEWLVDRAEKLLVGYSEGHDLRAELPALGITNDQYEIIDANGKLLSGSVLASDRPVSQNGAPVFRLLTVRASPVRAVSIQRDTQVGNLTVTVVEEVTSRSENNYTLLVDVLISNALIHGAPDTRIAITGSIEQGSPETGLGDFWVLKVRDNGPGIPERHWTEVFKPMVSLHAASDDKGVGMGLAILDKIALHCGGRAWVARPSRDMQGASLCLALPLSDETQMQSPARVRAH